MGCDIHAFIEWDTHDGIEPFSDADYIESFSTGELRINRHYLLFAALAGVRGDDNEQPMFPPRGVPEFVSADVFYRYFALVCEKQKDVAVFEPTFTPPMTRYAKASVANWGDNVRHEMHTGWAYLPAPEGCYYHANIEWHSASWLYLDEIQAASANIEMRYNDVDFPLILRILQSLEESFGEHRARLVFWFDN